VKAILHYKNPERIIIMPSSARNDKNYAVSDEYRLAMLDIFADEINDSFDSVTLTKKESALLSRNNQQILRTSGWQKQGKIIIDDHFIRNWEWEMITRDVDLYAREKYGEDIIHIFGTDTIESMPLWDSEWYTAKVVRKIFVPRDSFSHHSDEGRIHASEKIKPGSLPLSWVAPTLSDARIREYGSLWSHIVPQDDGYEALEFIDNFEFFIDSHIPDISSTEIRKIIPEHTGLKEFFEENPKFIIPGLSKRISQYILENRLYRPKAEKKPKILVHVCCGPDVTMPIIQLRDEYDIICFWYDPNIQPKSEYDKRYEAFVKVCEIEWIPYIKWAYDVKNFLTRIKWVEHTPERGEKCTYCYDMRMMVSAKLAAKFKIPLYTSSLNTSPKKDLEKLFLMWHKYATKYGVEFLDVPFRKKWGFAKSVEYTKEHDIYRQNYCGCIYSIREGGDSEMKGRMVG
jgi:epoxyqueuosine reductase